MIVVYYPKTKRKLLHYLKYISKKFQVTYEGGVESYLGMNVRKHPNGTITMSQPTIINKILNSQGFCNESKMHDSPENVILTKDEYGNGRK